MQVGVEYMCVDKKKNIEETTYYVLQNEKEH